MNRFARGALTVSMLSLSAVLTGCGSYDLTQFDPTAIFDAEIFNTKKKLPGERKAVFPEGTPGVPQGVPQELVKGNQPTGDGDASVQSAEAKPEAKPEAKAEAKPKPKPQPKVVAKPKEPKDESTPTAITVRPSPGQVEAQAQPQPQPQPQSQVQWPDPPPMQARPSGGVAWPDPPAPR
jgi:hypothetical protein